MQRVILQKWQTENWTTAQKVSKCGVFSGPHFPVFSLNTEK